MKTSKTYQGWPAGMPVAPKCDEVHQAKPFIGQGCKPFATMPKYRPWLLGRVR